MKRLLPIALLATTVLFAAGADAQPRGQANATLTMRADRTRLEVGEVFRLTVEARINGASGNELQLPDLSAFEILQQRRTTPFSFRFGFGGQQQVQSTVRHDLTLRARQPGTIELSPAWVEIGGQRFESNALTFEVGGTAVDPGQPANDPNALPPAHNVDGMQFDPNGFLRTWVDDGEPYVGQQVTVTVYLYLPQPLRGSPQITQEPNADGFWVQDLLGPSRELRPQVQRMNNRTFQVYLLRRFAAFPLRPGEATIGATALSLPSGGLLGGIFGGGGQRPPQRVQGVPVSVDVRALPEPPRSNGEPHVGTLELAAELDRAQVVTGDAVTLEVTATGRGALEQLRLPNPAGSGLRVLEPDIRDAISHPNDIVGGTRTFRWLIVPERAGEWTLGPFEVPVFDAHAETWSVARTPALSLTAAGNATSTETDPDEEPDGASSATDPEATFGPVHTRSDLSRTHASLSSQGWFLGLLAIGPLLLLGGLGARAAQRRAASDDPSRAPRRAKKAAAKLLADAKGHAAAGEPRRFYAAVSKSLTDVLAAKLGAAVGSLTHPELRARLADRGMDEALADEVVDELEGCDFARFSAVGVSAKEMNGCLERTKVLLAKLDRFTPAPQEDD